MSVSPFLARLTSVTTVVLSHSLLRAPVMLAQV